MNEPTTFALPVEPLLDAPTSSLRGQSVNSDASIWLNHVGGESDLNERAETVFTSLRKRSDARRLIPVVEGILVRAYEGDTGGVAALAALVAVRAPGFSLIESVREFGHTHRMVRRIEAKQQRNFDLDSEERRLHRAWEQAVAALAPYAQNGPADAGALPSPRDLGPAGVVRRVFEATILELERRGTLDEDAISRFIQLARLEILAATARASSIAATIDPFSASAVSRSMPILAAIDADARDGRSFLAVLENRKDPRVFHEQRPLFRDLLSDAEATTLMTLLGGEARTFLARRLLGALDRAPVHGRALAYFTSRVLELGTLVHERGLRDAPIDLVHALLIALEFHDDGRVRMPAGREVATLIAETVPDGIDVEDNFVLIPFDPGAARRVRAPYGLPVPEVLAQTNPEEEADLDQGLKNLVMENINNVSVLMGLIRNPKVIGAPGIVPLVASSCRSVQILSMICQDRALHTGQSNREVPVLVLRSPVRVPIRTLRKFINVKYVRKMELRRMIADRTSVRREVWEEIHSYLKSLK